MFQPFILVCMLGTEPQFETCRVMGQPAFYGTEEECQSEIYVYMTDPYFALDIEGFEVADVGCINFLEKFDPDTKT